MTGRFPDSEQSDRSPSPVDHKPGHRALAWRLIKPYWVSEDRWPARGLLALVIALNLAIVYINVRINTWYAGFYNALDKRDMNAFEHLIWVFTLLAFIFIGLATARIYFRQKLEFRWRQWLTDVFLHRWLDGRVFYQVERDHSVDNPDQRISEDLRDLASNTLALSLDLLSTVVTLFSFVTILWVLSGSLSFVLAGHHITIPGYMVWAAGLYALVGSYVIHRVGRRLVSISYRQQKVEADFRFMMVRLRENAEQIAFYDGGPAESRNLRAAFSAIRENWRDIMTFTKRLVFASSVYGQIAILFPFMAAAPRYFAGAFSLGVLMQLNSAFGQVSDAFSWFLNSYSTLAGWRATVNRLLEFDQGLENRPDSGIHVDDGAHVQTQQLEILRPDGSALIRLPQDWLVAPGERWLLRGPSGSGKSTVLRALAGLWPFGQGQVRLPGYGVRGGANTTLFVPQRSYLPSGSLKAALCYPREPEGFSDEACQQVLRDSQLAAYVGELNTVDLWSQRLSPGEQQRLAIARVLLLKPQFLFLDEATSSLDPDNEKQMYEQLCAALPDTAIISVAHRESVARYHHKLMQTRGDGVLVEQPLAA